MKINQYKGMNNISGKYIRQARKQHNLTQQQLSEMLAERGLPLRRDCISRIEQGIRFVNDMELSLIADCLKVPVSKLLGLK